MKLATWLVDSRTFARRHRIGIAVAVFLVVAYALAGFFWVPRIARSEITDYVTQTLHRKVSIADLTFNPFTFVAHVRGFALTEEDGSPLVRLDHLLVNAELSSLPRRALVLKEVRLDAPDIRVIVGKDGAVNLARLAPPPSAPPPANAEPSAPPRVRIGRLAVVGGQISVRDESRPQPVSLALSPIEFALADFSTERNYQNAYRFSGSTLAGERFEWTGEFTVQPLGSIGQFRVQDLKAATIDEYLAEALPPKLASGLLSLNGNYRFTLLPFTLNLTLPAISVRDLKLAARGNETETPIALPALDVTETVFSYEKRTLRVQKVALQQPHVDFVRTSPTATNLATLFATQEGAKPAAAESHLPTVTQSDTSAEPASASPWKVNIDTVQLTEGSIAAEDRTTKPAAKFAFAPLNVTVSNLSSDAAVPAKIAADVRINERGKVSVTSSLTRTPLGGDYSVELSDIPLTALEPYVEQRTAANLSSGDFAAKGSGSFTSVEGKPLQLKFAGGLAVKKLKTTDRIANDRFVEWDEIAIDGIDFGLAPDKLRIEKITARKPFARVVIERNRSLNVMNVLRLGGPPPPEEDDTASEESQSPPPPPKNPPPAPKNVEKPFPAEIRSIEIIDGTTRFADNSVDPSFHAGILQLRGGIQGLSSNPASRAKVQLQGSVDRYAPVDIKGEVNVLSAAKYTDIAMSFRNMELTLFNPYSGKFAGYNITKGKLSTELHYKVDDRKLDAEHHIIVDNLEFGAKTDSKDAAPVPVKLCVALLKDRNGVIDINLPVSGSLDDPHFRLGPIVWKAVLGLLKKIATAPFAALGSLFGGGPELAYVDFPLGTADLSQTELDKIQKLSKALGSRPQLKLSLPATVVGDEDRKALTEAALHAQVAPPTAQTPAESKRYLDALERLYKATKKEAVQYPESAAKDAELVDDHIHFLEPKLLELLAPDDAAVNRLGRQRARAVQDQLLTNTEINPERVFVTTEPVEHPNIDGHARMQMKLE